MSTESQIRQIVGEVLDDRLGGFEKRLKIVEGALTHVATVSMVDDKFKEIGDMVRSVLDDVVLKSGEAAEKLTDRVNAAIQEMTQHAHQHRADQNKQIDDLREQYRTNSAALMTSIHGLQSSTDHLTGRVEMVEMSLREESAFQRDVETRMGDQARTLQAVVTRTDMLPALQLQIAQTAEQLKRWENRFIALRDFCTSKVGITLIGGVLGLAINQPIIDLVQAILGG